MWSNKARFSLARSFGKLSVAIISKKNNIAFICPNNNAPSSIFCQLLLDLENYNSSLKVLFCCCRTFPRLIVINRSFCWESFITFWANYLRICNGRCYFFLTGDGGHTKVDRYTNYLDCDMFVVLIPFQIFILSAVQGSFKTEWYFFQKKAKNVLFYDQLLSFCSQLYCNSHFVTS